ncbi:enoyl-CoA hydratase/isomerase family protein [Tistrella sp. BH-R2-4]|uniref:Enoyl-CoA hydratase/isomerase family protein n=1 Tax=Tistrella arctica TaxID=3133430 RepID=A0ABU9YRT9_9PROT
MSDTPADAGFVDGFAEGAVLLERRGPVAWVRMNMPDRRNALGLDLTAGLARALDAVEADAGFRVMVITGSGKAFSAGGDLALFKGLVGGDDLDGFDRYLERGRAMFTRIEQFRRPVIAAVNGVTVAGGLELMLTADLVYAAASARIGDGHVKFGVIPGGGSTARLSRRLPFNVASDLLLTGRLADPVELAAHGLINAVLPDDQLEAHVQQTALHIAGHSADGLARIKALHARARDRGLDDALATEVRALLDYARGPDLLEGLTAFVEKRTPRFT